jgi:hypothetical protein
MIWLLTLKGLVAKIGWSRMNNPTDTKWTIAYKLVEDPLIYDPRILALS